MALSASSGTPKGTAPQPKRLATKHKDPAYGTTLIAKAATRRAARAEHQKALKILANKPAKELTDKEREAVKAVGKPLRRPARLTQGHRRMAGTPWGSWA